MSVLLSILVPAFEYPEGVQNILERVPTSFLDDGLVEVIVRDDSKTDRVGEIVSNFDHAGSRIKYIKNALPDGAVNNWNALLDLASGEYVILMHHDEFPCDYRYFETLLRILKGEDRPDVIVSGCTLLNNQFAVIREHVPNFVRRLVISFTPGYIFRRNVIGPSGTLTFKRNLNIHFDQNLKWLVDVDFYYRLRMLTNSWIVQSQMVVYSVAKRQGSITASIKDELKKIKNNELAYLNLKYPPPPFWLQKHLLIDFLEACAWAFMRFFQTSQALLLPTKYKLVE